jgi:hypothetical protein
MAGGVAILIGTLLGMGFPMGGGQNTAQLPLPKATTKTSKVLPANINVNSTASGDAPTDNINNKTTVAQNNNTNSNTTNDTTNDATTTGNTPDTTTTNNNNNDDANQTSNTNKSPVRALW